jgi:hypothetical protein
VWPARGLNNFISAISILCLCEAAEVQFSDPYKNVGKTKRRNTGENSCNSGDGMGQMAQTLMFMMMTKKNK